TRQHHRQRCALWRDHRAAVGQFARRVAEVAGPYQAGRRMSRVGLIRLLVIVAAVAALEWACRAGWIDHRVVIPPSEMATALVRLLKSGEANAEIARTFGIILLSVAIAVVVGFAFGLIVHALPRVRQALEPFFATYYAVPIFIFYPVMIAIFGLSSIPIVLMGFATAVVAMIIA